MPLLSEKVMNELVEYEIVELVVSLEPSCTPTLSCGLGTWFFHRLVFGVNVIRNPNVRKAVGTTLILNWCVIYPTVFTAPQV